MTPEDPDEDVLATRGSVEASARTTSTYLTGEAVVLGGGETTVIAGDVVGAGCMLDCTGLGPTFRCFSFETSSES